MTPDRAANPSHALALVVVDELARCGVRHVALAPGSRSTALAMALHDDPRIRLHVEIDERSAGFLALGVAKATGTPAAVVCTSGSAVSHLHPAVIEADTARVPLLLLTADRPPELRHTGANQTIDQIKLFGDAVRWFVEVGVPEDRPGSVAYWRSTVSRLVAEAVGVRGLAGPVHANLAFREPTVPLRDDGRSSVPSEFAQRLDGRVDRRPWTALDRPPRRLPEDELDALAARLLATERGLLVVGDTVAAPGPLLDLARAAGWPVIAEPMSGARHGDNAISCAHHLAGVAGFAADHRPDLVVRIGRSGLSRPVAELVAGSATQLVLDGDGAWLDPARSVSDLVVADPATTCAALADRMGPPATSDWLTSWRDAEATARARVDAILDAEDTPNEPRVARDLAAAVPDHTCLIVASSMPVRDLDAYMRPRRSLRVLANRGASGIDGFVSSVLGAGLGLAEGTPGLLAAATAGPVVALAGDLSLLHDANGFLLAPDAERVGATFVVVNNDGGGIFSFLPQARFPASFERVFGTPHGRDLATLASFHGLGHRSLTAASELGDALRAAADAGGINLIEIRTDRAANVALHRRIGDEVTAALG